MAGGSVCLGAGSSNKQAIKSSQSTLRGARRYAGTGRMARRTHLQRQRHYFERDSHCIAASFAPEEGPVPNTQLEG